MRCKTSLVEWVGLGTLLETSSSGLVIMMQWNVLRLYVEYKVGILM